MRTPLNRVTKRSFSLPLLACLIMLALVACSEDKTSPSTTAEPSASAAYTAKARADREAAQKAAAAMASFSSDELRKLAALAFREQRLYAPAGNNAAEYYLAIRKKSGEPDPLTESALMDLMPYTVIAAEQAISRSDFAEAGRLRDLIAVIDAGAPALPRISQEIADGLNNVEALALAEAKREEERLLALEKTAAKTPENVLKPEPIEPILRPAPAAAQTPAIAAPPVAAQTQANPVAVAPAPSRNVAPPSNSVAKSELVAIRTPDPSFPSDALNRGLSGAVEVEFIVQRSGEVSEVRIVNSSQRAFDRNVVTTVKRWKFAPLAEPMTVRRSFNFNNPS